MVELFRRHSTHSTSVARRILPAQEEFLNAIQSAYLSAYQNFWSFRAEASSKSRITRIVHRSEIACLLPAAPERFIELNQALVFVIPRLREGEFGLKQ